MHLPVFDVKSIELGFSSQSFFNYVKFFDGLSNTVIRPKHNNNNSFISCFIVRLCLFPIVQGLIKLLLKVLVALHLTSIAFHPFTNPHHNWLSTQFNFLFGLLKFLSVEFNLAIQLLRLLWLSVCITRNYIRFSKPLFKYFTNLLGCFLSANVAINSSNNNSVSCNKPVLILNLRSILKFGHFRTKQVDKKICCHYRYESHNNNILSCRFTWYIRNSTYKLR